jgi:preprotein translocase subunit SecD
LSRGERVGRPTRKNEYEIFFASNRAAKGWADLVATQRNQMIGVWDFLSSTPLNKTVASYPLKGDHGVVTFEGTQHERWQLKLNLRSGARIWYFVIGNRVYLEQVHTSHPNETK